MCLLRPCVLIDVLVYSSILNLLISCLLSHTHITHSRAEPTSPVRVVSITSRQNNRLRSSKSPDPVLGHIELSPNHLPLSLESHASSSATPPRHLSPSVSPPPQPVTNTDTNSTATTSFIAMGNGTQELQNIERDHHVSSSSSTTDNITGQRSSSKKPEPSKQSQEKTLFGVIVKDRVSRSGAESPSGEGRAGGRGLTHAEVVAEQEKRNNRRSSHTSTSSTPKNSPKVNKKHKIKLGHFRNGK